MYNEAIKSEMDNTYWLTYMMSSSSDSNYVNARGRQMVKTDCRLHRVSVSTQLFVFISYSYIYIL